MKKWLYWIPRILAIIFTVFLSIFAFDVFEEGFSWYALAGFFIHLIPNYILIAVTVVAWKNISIKRINVGGAIFILLGIFYMCWARGFDIIAYLVISGPLIITGILFILGTLSKNKIPKKIKRKKK